MKRILRFSGYVMVAAVFLLVGTAFAGERVFYYHTDPAGTPLAMTDVNGNVVWQADYKPFGEEQSITGTLENNEKFVGKEKDKETGLQYFGARYMKDEIGRFITVDPVGPVDPRTSKTNYEMLTNPQKLNRYAYSLNNPYRYIDPDGKLAMEAKLFGQYLTWRKQFIESHLNWAPLLEIVLPTEPMLPGPMAMESTGGRLAGNALERVTSLLRPGGKLIGEEGTSAATRIMRGGRAEAERFFNELAEGANIMKHPQVEGGSLAELPGGGTIGYRPVSKSGPPTVDVHRVPECPKNVEIKFVE